MALAPAERGAYPQFLPGEGRMPLVNEVRAVGEFFNIQFHPIYFGFGVPHGTGDPVLTIPGFTASDASLFYLNTFLRRINYRVYPSGIIYHRNPEHEITRLSQRVKEIHKREGQKVHIVGHSLGGVVGRGVCHLNPNEIASFTAFGSPIGDFEKDVDPFVLAWANMTVPSFNQPDELRKRKEQLSEPLHGGIKTTYIYTIDDGVIDWRSTVDNSHQAKNIEVPGTHSALVANPHAFRHLANTLADTI
ncbi:MAG: alpha/beta hydrolase [Patescibacteria group bacterium]